MLPNYGLSLAQGQNFGLSLQGLALASGIWPRLKSVAKCVYYKWRKTYATK